jgi:hypothetical protein
MIVPDTMDAGAVEAGDRHLSVLLFSVLFLLHRCIQIVSPAS